MSGRKKIIITITGVLLCIIAIIGYNYIHRQLFRKEGFVGAEMVRIEDVNYRYTSFELSKEGKTIGLIDDWLINEIHEDLRHFVVVVWSFIV